MKSPKTARRGKKNKKRGSLLKKSLFFGIGFSVLAGIIVCIVYYIRASMLDIRDVGQIPQRSFVYDVNGTLYSRLFGQNRVLVQIDQVSPYFIDALIAREDSRFYEHGGIDPRGIARAILRNLLSRSAKEGASTITQQLARNSFDLGGRTLDRKILEAFVALRIEHTFSKRQILDHYINRIYYGFGNYGLEIATQSYFGKPCKDLTLGEAALMAGLIRSPNNFSPLKSIPLARRERDNVLDRMASLGKISATNAEKAKAEPIRLVKNRAPVVQENYVMDAVQADLGNLLTQDQIDQGGMRIYTTVDPILQKTAEQALDQSLIQIENRPGYPHPQKTGNPDTDNEYLQGAVVVIDNHTGGIRALVGGRDHHSPQDFNRALFAKRQVGSAIKPFVYAAAYADGMLPGEQVSDAPIESGEVPEAANWHPGNSDGGNRGILPAEDGLILSRNTMTVRVGENAGLGKIRALAVKCGLGDLPNFPASFLGAFEETPRDLTSAYTVFPNQGLRRQNYLIERIDDKNGQPIYLAAHIEQRALDPGVAWLTTGGLRQVLQKGTAASAKSLGFTQIAAGKTGTTNDYKDAWFIGFTSSLTCGVWVGFDKPVPIFPGGYGATLALPVWVKVMKSAPAGQYVAKEFDPGVPLQKTLVCSISNGLATDGCKAAGTAYEMDLPVSLIPAKSCPVHQGALAETLAEPKKETAASLPARVFNSFLNLFRGKNH